MITGAVTDDGQPVIRLLVRGTAGAEAEVDALVDTGFFGSLALPPATIAHLGLSWRGRDWVVLADGSRTRYDSYDAVVVWDGRPRRILVESANVFPLVGMNLLAGYRLTVDARPGGPVTVEALA